MNRDERAARRWVKRMLRDRPRFEAGYRRWIHGRPDREALYTEIWGAVADAGLAGRSIASQQRSDDQAASQPLPSSRVTRIVALAAVLIIIAGLLLAGTAMIPWLHKEPNPPTYLAGSTIFQTRVGEVRTMRLPDGSHVILDTDTRIALRFTQAERGIELTHGRARFDVAHDPGHPFIVYAAGGSVTATGTLFDVTNIENFKVNLLRGSITVVPPPRPGAPSVSPLRLHPGQMVAFSPHQYGTPLAATEAKPSEAQWVSGMKTFDDVPVRDIIAEANSYSVDKIELATPALGDTEAFIDLDIRDTNAVAHKLANYLHLIVDRGTPGKIILRADK